MGSKPAVRVRTSQVLVRPHGARRLADAEGLPGGLLLPRRIDAVDADRARLVPGWLPLPQGVVPPRRMLLRLQVPGGVGGPDQMPAALVLPGQQQHQDDPVPDWIHVRPAGHVRADAVPSGVVRVVRGEEVVRRVPRGALLLEHDVVGAVPGGVVLPDRGDGADAVPGEPVLPLGVGRAQGLRAGDDVGGRGGVGQGVRVRGGGAWAVSMGDMDCIYKSDALMVLLLRV